MSIVTKTGDDGTTGLWSEERIPKDDIRVEAYGTLDELSSALGMARHLCFEDEVLYAIDHIQKLLVRVSGELASFGKPFDRPVTPQDEELMSGKIAVLAERIPLTGFVLPGMTQGSAALDLARTIARRAERRVVSLSRRDGVSHSDYLYMLARAEEAASGKIRFV
ncbi:MAG: ATP/cobalamin adenosyltransferase [Spirochaetes bacterium]|nr:MAG: ATP/cobalamin adenosyltransferase [Spirochaetota bacterium]